MFKPRSRVKETTTTTGTGTLTLLGAVTGHLAASAVGDGNDAYWCVQHDNGTEWEVFRGTYTASGTTLSRTFVASSTGSAVSLSAGTKEVFCCDLGEVAEYLDTIRGTYSSQTYVACQANDSGSNVHYSIVPKGTGAVLAAIPDGTSTGGDNRGTNAVDLQTERSSAGHVASGDNATIGGGGSNTASGDWSTVPGGFQCVASGDYSTAFGRSATTRGILGVVAHAADEEVVVGDRQNEMFQLKLQTTSATAATATADGGAASATNIPILPDDSAYVFEANVIAREDATGDCAAYRILGMIKRGTGAASTTISGIANTVIAEDDASWGLWANANTTLGGLQIRCTGAASHTIDWSVTVKTTEVVT